VQATKIVQAKLISSWDNKSTTREGSCIVNIETGVVTPGDTAECEEMLVEKLDSQHVILGQLYLEVTESLNGELQIMGISLPLAADLAACFPNELPDYLYDRDYLENALTPGFNTCFGYMYRDGMNFKKSHAVILSGVIQPQQLKLIHENLLRDVGDDDFLPKQVGLAALCPDVDDHSYVPDFDHPVHTVTCIRLTKEQPTNDVNVVDFANKFAAIGPEGWDQLRYGNLGPSGHLG
jgi:hypothetical protein